MATVVPFPDTDIYPDVDVYPGAAPGTFLRAHDDPGGGFVRVPDAADTGFTRVQPPSSL